MKNYIYTVFISLATLSLFAEKTIVRDPFWPVGYTPPPPPGMEKPVVKPPPVIKKLTKPKPPPKPVTSDDWKLARKLLKVNGYALGKKQAEGITNNTSRVIINLKHYNTNNEIKLNHNAIDFVWTVGPIENSSVKLIQKSAVRVTPGKDSSKKGAPTKKLSKTTRFME